MAQVWHLILKDLRSLLDPNLEPLVLSISPQDFTSPDDGMHDQYNTFTTFGTPVLLGAVEPERYKS